MKTPFGSGTCANAFARGGVRGTGVVHDGHVERVPSGKSTSPQSQTAPPNTLAPTEKTLNVPRVQLVTRREGDVLWVHVHLIDRPRGFVHRDGLRQGGVASRVPPLRMEALSRERAGPRGHPSRYMHGSQS